VRTLKTILSLDMRGFRKSLRAAAKGVRRFSKDVGKPLGAAAAKMGRLLAIASGLAAVFASFGMGAAGRVEALRLQLANLSSGAEDFGKQWQVAMDLFIRSPLELEPVIEATALLSAFGVKGEDNLKKVAAAAVAMNRPMGDMVRAIGSMETESFRRLGIEVRKVGDEFTLNFRDKAGKSMQSFASGIDAARKAAIEVLGIKFGGSLELAAKTLEGAKSTFRGLRTLALAQLFENIAGKYTPQLIRLNDKIIELSENGAFKRFGERAGAQLEKVVNVVRRVALAIHHLNQNSGGNLLKWAGIFAGVGLAFKMGLALPIIKASAMIGKAFIKSILIPFKSAFLVIFALIASFNIARALDEAFDLSGIVVRTSLQLKAMAAAFQNVFKNLADPEAMKIEDDRIAKDLADALARLKPSGSGDFWAELKKSFEKTMADAAAMGDKILDGLIPQGIEDMIAMLNTLPDIVLPQLAAQMPDFGAAVEDGVRRGMTARKHMRINGAGGSQASANADRIRNDTLAKINAGGAKNTAMLQKLADREGLRF
jgi:hypothetical protein